MMSPAQTLLRLAASVVCNLIAVISGLLLAFVWDDRSKAVTVFGLFAVVAWLVAPHARDLRHMQKVIREMAAQHRR